MSNPDQKVQRRPVGARPGDPCALEIFGAAGDLTKRLLVPSLYNLHTSKLLPENFAIVGVTASKFSDEDFREKLTKDIQEFARSPVQKELWDWFKPKIYYHAGDFRDPNVYKQLKDKLAAVDKQQGWKLPLLSSDRAAVFRGDHQAARHGRTYRRGQRILAPRDYREAVRPRPRVRPRAKQGNHVGGRREPDLPHRSLRR